MKTLQNPPNVSAMLSSLRSMGYSMATALADIIDNSVAAAASHIDIRFSQLNPYIAVIDDGVGMDYAGVIEAMRHGGSGPDVLRRETDLGRYGLGLKTASLSQCRQLTVVSLQEGGSTTAARWDLGFVQKSNAWSLLLLDDNEIVDLPCIELLRERGHGTIVLWQLFDHELLNDDPDALVRAIEDSSGYLALVFHRYLSAGYGESQISIAVNGEALTAMDPFLRANPKTEELPAEFVTAAGAVIRIQAYILPHQTNLSSTEHALLANSGGLMHGQGFYVYRNRRLIIWGTWFGLLGSKQIHKLARVQVDIPNTLDHLWRLDIKKSTADPPQAVRSKLKHIMEELADASSKVIRGRRPTQPQRITVVWKREPERGLVSYLINRDHPAISDLSADLTVDSNAALERALQQIELGLPFRSIYSDMNRDARVGVPTEIVEAQLRNELVNRLARASDIQAREVLLQVIPNQEPFSMHPEITGRLLQEVSKSE